MATPRFVLNMGKRLASFRNRPGLPAATGAVDVFSAESASAEGLVWSGSCSAVALMVDADADADAWRVIVLVARGLAV